MERDNCEGNSASADESGKEFQDEIAITLQYASRVLYYKLSGTAKLFGSSSRIYWQSAISSGLGIHFSGDDWSALGARRNCIYSYAIRITIASHAFLIKRPTQLERVNRFRSSDVISFFEKFL